MRRPCGIKRIKEGFTLLELLLAVTIFSVIALSLYSSLNAGIRVLKRSQTVMRFHQGLRLACEELALELRNAVKAPLYKEEVEGGGSKVEGKDSPSTFVPFGEASPALRAGFAHLRPSTSDEEPVLFFLGAERRFSFVSLKDDSLCNITYYFNQDGRLMKSVQYQSKGFTAKPDEDMAVLEDIEAFEASYSYQREGADIEVEWRKAWELEETIPLGVRIKMRFRGAGRLKAYTKTVFIPVGKLGTEEGAL